MKRFGIMIALLSILASMFSPVSYAAVDREENKRIIFDYITNELKLNAAVACGILANIKNESNFDPEAIGDGGDAYGICQWNSRRDTMVKFCEDNGFGSWRNIYGQLAYLGYELETYKKSVGDFLKNIPNTPQGAYDAAYHFCYYYEIPANRTTKSKERGILAVNTFWCDFYGGDVETYTITYDANGGNNPPKSQIKTEGIPTLITLGKPVLSGYSLVGWSLNPDASTLDYKEYEEFCINKDTTLYAVWERVIEDETPPSASLSSNGHTYELYTGSFTWTFANEFAEKKGGYLATVETQAEYDVVKNLISTFSGDCWLGGKFADGNWQWVTGEAFRDDFAKWAKGEPYALYGKTERGKLAQTQDGKWIDLHYSSFATEGFIVEYGSKTHETFPMYEITVSSSLRLREGPGTSYDTLSNIYNGEIITILDTVPGKSYDWGWGYTAGGKIGWCAMKMPDYMVSVGGVDEETALVYIPYEEGCAIIGYQGNEKLLIVPKTLQSLPVIAIQDGAFASQSAPDTVTLPEGILEIAPDSMKAGGKYLVPVASDAHLAVLKAKAAHDIILPSKTLCPPNALSQIEADAFEGAKNIECVDLSKTNVTLISTGAFSDMDALLYVLLPETDVEIEFGAFELGSDTIFIVKKGSSAEKWAMNMSVDYLSVP